MKAAFFVTPFPGSAGGSVQPFSGQTAASLSGELCRQPVAMLLRFHPATDLQNNGPPAVTLVTPDLTVP